MDIDFKPNAGDTTATYNQQKAAYLKAMMLNRETIQPLANDEFDDAMRFSMRYVRADPDQWELLLKEYQRRYLYRGRLNK